MTSFEAMVRAATGRGPYPWQQRVADEGLPELIAVETGAGKTAGVVLPWLHRRRFHADLEVRSATPHWLVVCLPLRTLVEQSESEVQRWIAGLGLSDNVLVHVAMGGRERRDDPWRLHPESDAIVLGTVDMLLSRALNRGYAASRFSWPIDFGLLNNGVAWVLDEVQLLGPALPTTRQLQAFRQRLGTALPTSSTWMSATVDPAAMATVDNSELASVVTLDDSDRANPALSRRLKATRRVTELPIQPRHPKRAQLLADALSGHHRPGTLTLAVLNTVRAARQVAAALGEAAGPAPVTLLHSRFRPEDRQARLAEATAPPSGPGRIVVATQVVEAGIDISAAVLLTEAAPWPSIVQRAGRCNRDGANQDAELLWAVPARPDPYLETDVNASVDTLRTLEGQPVTATQLRETAVPVSRVSHAVLRQVDLVGLFDTAPDLSGNDIDVAQFIRVADELDLHLAWRDLNGASPEPAAATPTARELCAVPAGKELRDLIGQRGGVWRLDHLRELGSGWVRARPDDVRPGVVLLADTSFGGYSPMGGWDARITASVDPVPDLEPSGLVVTEEGLGEDPLSVSRGIWLELERHLADVERVVRELDQVMQPSGLSAAMREAAAVAGRLQDIGKAHPVFLDTMVRCGEEQERDALRARGPWAKSGGPHRARHRRRYFRHELASALALLGEASACLDGSTEADLIVYLVAAHHGRVRLAMRSMPEEQRGGAVLGVKQGDRLPAVVVPGGTLPASTLSLDVAQLGRGPDGTRSWSERSLGLRDRADLGPLRLAFLEAVVRLADWRASREAEVGS